MSGYGYVTLAPGTDPAVGGCPEMAPLLDRVLESEIKKLAGNIRGSMVYDIHLTPFAKVHLTSDRWSFNMTAPGS